MKKVPKGADFLASDGLYLTHFLLMVYEVRLHHEATSLCSQNLVWKTQ
jgi:hypothetical protein